MSWEVFLFMFNRIFAIILGIFLLIPSFLPVNKVLAVDGLSINATVGGQQSLEIGDDGKVTTTVMFDLIPEGTASSNRRKPMDVVIVFDKSGSMADDVSRYKTKLELAQEAVQEGVDIFFENKNKGFDDRYGLVAFDSGVNHVYTLNGLHSNPNVVANKTKQAPALGGTNYTDALREAANMLLNAKDKGKFSGERDQYIIFMTDGKPTNSSKYENVKGNYYPQLIQHEIYERIHGYGSYREKLLSGKFTLYDNDYYIISDNYKYIKGEYLLHFDSNSEQNNIIIEHETGPYLLDRYKSTVPESIKEHGREQARILAENDITLLSIGFGNQNQLDMNYLTELSAMSNGKAERATPDNIVEIFEDISSSISDEYSSLSNGFLKFELPKGVTVQQNDQIAITDNEVIMNLKDIKYNPTPPKAGDASLHYELPLTFLTPGEFEFKFDVLYNSGDVAKRDIPYKIVVINPLKQINFTQETKTIKVGEEFKVKDYLSFFPNDATNQLIREVVNKGFQSPISIYQKDGEWYVKGREGGNTSIEAIADEKYPSISDTMKIIVESPLEQIQFNQETKSIKVGEVFKVKDYLSFFPSSATNQSIKEVINQGSKSPIGIYKKDGDWYVEGREIGITDIEAIADEKYPSISDRLRVIVTKNSNLENKDDFKW